MNGHKFEYKCARMLRRKGFHHVEVTKKSGDQGVEHQKDGFVIRRNAIETGVNVLTSLDTAEALVTSLENTDANKLSLIDIATIARR